jgi:hypothetical protein
VKENGNTSVTIPVRIGTIPAAQGVGSLAQKGSILIRINGSAVINLNLATWEKPFEQTREFSSSEFSGLLLRPSRERILTSLKECNRSGDCRDRSPDPNHTIAQERLIFRSSLHVSLAGRNR